VRSQIADVQIRAQPPWAFIVHALLNLLSLSMHACCSSMRAKPPSASVSSVPAHTSKLTPAPQMCRAVNSTSSAPFSQQTCILLHHHVGLAYERVRAGLLRARFARAFVACLVGDTLRAPFFVSW